MSPELATAVVTMMFMPAMVFGIVCGVCILKLIAFYVFRCFRRSKHDYLITSERQCYIAGLSTRCIFNIVTGQHFAQGIIFVIQAVTKISRYWAT